MSRSIRFELGGATHSAELGTKIDKSALYGRARRVAVKDGVELSRGVLLADGRLFPAAALRWLRTDPLGTPAEEPQTLDGDGPAELKPSSFDIDNPLLAVPLTMLLRFEVDDVYPLDGLALAPGAYQTEFSYRKSFQPRDAIVLVTDSGGYLLVGQALRAGFLERTLSYEFFDAKEELDEADDLDFALI